MDPVEFQKATGKMATHFTAAIQNAVIYPADHPQVLSYVRETHRLLKELFAWKREITFLLIGDGILADKHPLLAAGVSESALVQIMKANALERVTFFRDLPLASLEAFIRHLSSATLATMRPSRYIAFGKLQIKDDDDPEGNGDGDDGGSAAAESEKIHNLETLTADERIRNIFTDTLEGRNINRQDPDEIVRHFMESMSREANPLRLLAQTKSNDEYTFTHASNVGILTLFLAEHLGFKGSDLNRIGVAAILHDVGKIRTPDAILSKPGPLTPDERAVMEAHTLQGALYLMEQANINNIAVLAALEHHRKYDGSGYPNVMGGWEQGIASQIISIADVYDALRTKRPYRQDPMPPDRIVQILKKGSGTEFNPALVDRFLRLIDR